MRLTKRVHLIGSGRLGLAMSDDYDCNIYLVDGVTELAIVDAGAGHRSGELSDLVVAAGFDPVRVGVILLTHKHPDHSGGAGDFQRTYGTRVAASEATARAVTDAVAMNNGLTRARQTGTYPHNYRFTGVDRVDTLGDGDTVAVGGVTIRAIDTTGHCNGHMAFVLDDEAVTVFTGDALLPGGEIVIQPTSDLSIPASIASIERLDALRFDALMPGHGSPALRDGFRHARLALLESERVGVPTAFRAPPFYVAGAPEPSAGTL